MAKAKVSVTVDRTLLRRCDRIARGATRSEVFEQALEKWLRDLRRRSLEEDIER
jgi:metal-responsive CopG/Arc/MetJ family transcriptional regulator